MMKINHIGIEVSDLFKMELFYRRVFGFKSSYRYESMNTPGLRTVMLEKDGVMLELLQRNRAHDFIENSNTDNFHMSFHTDDVKAEYERIKSLTGKGIKELRQPRTTGDGYDEFMFKDPEGNVIEIGRQVVKYGDHRIKAVIFDLDGTLIDSEENYYQSDKILMKEYGIDLTPEMKHKFVGMGNFKMMQELKLLFDIDASAEYLTERKNEYYLQIAKKNTVLYPEMKIFIGLLKDAGFPMAIASGSSSDILDELVPLVKLDEYFNVIVSADHVENGKPAPDIFLKAAGLLGVRPENCLVVEDSKYGVEAAVRAFMYCIAVPYLTGKLDDVFFMSDFLCESGMKDFDAERAFGWIKKINSKKERL